VGRLAPPDVIGDGVSSTVFIARGSQPEFNEGRTQRSGQSLSVTGQLLAPSSTSTATVTIVGHAKVVQRAGSGFSLAAPNSAKPMPAVSATASAPAAPPSPSYQYAAPPGADAKSTYGVASFSGVFTASETPMRVYRPIISANRLSITGPGRPGSLFTGGAARNDARLIDLTLPIDSQVNATFADGTALLLPASISADPADATDRYLASVLDAGSGKLPRQTVAAFRVRSTKKASIPFGAVTIAADPFWRKMIVGTGRSLE
jgi:hypothetical protein